MERPSVIRLIFAVAWGASGVLSANAQEAAPQSKKIKVFVLSGQSGMACAGRSERKTCPSSTLLTDLARRIFPTI